MHIAIANEKLSGPHAELVMVGALVVTALLVRLAIDPFLGDKHQYVPALAAIAATTWIAGWRAATLAALACLLAGEFFRPISPSDSAGAHIALAWIGYVAAAVPIVAAAEWLRRDRQEADAGATATGLRDPSDEGRSGLRVLVVDDNPDAADTLAMLLQVNGHEAFTAPDGKGALDLASRQRLDIVFLDLGLPDMNGFEVAARLRSLLGPQPTLVALTGWGREEDRRRSRAAGCDAHLVKPVQPADLDQALALARVACRAGSHTDWQGTVCTEDCEGEPA